MLKLFARVFRSLPAKDKRRFIVLHVLMLCSSLAELAVLSLIPLLFLFFTAPATLKQIKAWQYVTQYIPEATLENPTFVAVGILSCVLLSNGFIFWVNLKLNRFGANLIHNFGTKLFRYYLSKPYLFFTQIHSSQLTYNLYNELTRYCTGVITPFLLLNTRLVLTVTLFLNLCFWDFTLSLSLAGIAFCIYGTFHVLTRKGLRELGASMSLDHNERARCMITAFDGIKEIKQLGIENKFSLAYNTASTKVLANLERHSKYTLAPKFVLETITFIAIGVMLFQFKEGGDDNGTKLAMMVTYALTGYRLMPSIQQIIGSQTTIKVSIASLDTIEKDLYAAESYSQQEQIPNSPSPLKIGIELNNVTFSYPNRPTEALRNITLSVKAGQRVAFVGRSGSGKTTLADLILGLFQPSSGEILFDGQELGKNRPKWLNTLGYVPQQIFLTDASIAENIAFGESAEHIDQTRLTNALKQAALYDFVQALPQKERTTVGERGVQLSGGQRQRIGIARALYRDTSVIIFDEASSALDGITEKAIIESINSIDRNKTIITIAHRITTVRNCDWIFFFEHGALKDQGTYEDLEMRVEDFKKMAGVDQTQEIG